MESTIKNKKAIYPIIVLLPPEAKAAMDILSTSRQKIGIEPENKFFFALPKRPNSKLCAWTVLNKYSEKSNLTRPELIKSTKLRKYLATTCQVTYLIKLPFYPLVHTYLSLV